MEAGRVHQISVSQGGVPKHPIETAAVLLAGIVGDRQANRRFHGGPDRALCLWSKEVIDLLTMEGHDIYPGAAGENLTISGLDWGLVVPGAAIRIGPQVLVEVTSYAKPCKANASWFTNGDFRRMSQVRYPGQSRVYTRVLIEGDVSLGDRVEITRDKDAPNSLRVQEANRA